MRRLTLSISEPLAGRQVRTLLRRELGLSAAGVYIVEVTEQSTADAGLQAGDRRHFAGRPTRLYQRLCPAGASPLRGRWRHDQQ